MIFHNMNLIRNLRYLQRPRNIRRFRRRESIEIFLLLWLWLLTILIFSFTINFTIEFAIIVQKIELGLRGSGKREWAPVSAEEEGSGADMKEDDSVARTDIVVDRPADSVGGFVREVDGNTNLAASGRGECRNGGRWVRVAWGRRVVVVDLDCRE